jgi:5-methylcytosine-specific restriction endonuclease McrA
VLREDKNAAFAYTKGFFTGKRFLFRCSKGETTAFLKKHEYDGLGAAQQGYPVAVAQLAGRQYWAYLGRFFWEDEGLSAADVQALVLDRERKKQRQLQRAHAAMQQSYAPPRRQPIPLEVRRAVWQRDGGRCVECGETFEIQYDHVIPVAWGGATSVENLQVLCGDCNRRKGASLG